MTSIYVYQDYIHNNGVLLRRLHDTFGADQVTLCDAGDILAGCLTQDVRLFIIPGGADLYTCEKLNGAGNRAIRTWVESGGNYLGICAGAYYACRRIEWAMDHPQDKIAQTRELNFFKGTARGPLHPLMESYERNWTGVADLATIDGPASAIYIAGPSFHADPGSDHDTVAAYDLPDAPEAIVSIRVGAGRALLCGPHIEYTPDLYRASLYGHKNSTPAWSAQTVVKFGSAWSPSNDLWSALIPPLVEPLVREEAAE